MFAEVPLEAVCERAQQMGFTAIDIWSPFGACRHLTEAVEQFGPRGLKQLLARRGLALGSFTTYANRTEKVGFPAYANFIKDFGGGLVVRESAYRNFEPGRPTSAMRKFFEELKPQIEQAAQAAAVLAIENHGKSVLNTADSLKAFVDLNPEPRHVGIALAPYHLQSINASVPDAIATCGSQLRFFYAWQNAEGMEQLPGEGPVDFVPWLQALDRANYTGYINPFFHGSYQPEEVATGLARARDYLHQCHTKVRRA